jgi:predicted deacylase
VRRKQMDDWKFALVPSPAPGTKAQDYVDWRDPVVSGWDWPYVAINGAKPGPAVLITGGIHGSEYASIDAVVRLAAALDPAAVSGQILLLPVLNPAAFWQRSAYVSPIDRLNLNRVFPGKSDGSFSERLAYLVVEKAMRKADAYIDLHGGDIPEALIPFTLCCRTGLEAVDTRSRNMAEAFGAPALIAQGVAEAPVVGLAYTTAANLKIPAILTEDGGAGQYDARIATRMQSRLENVLRHLKVLEGTVHQFDAPREFIRFSWVRTRAAGFFRPIVSVGEQVAAGQSLGVSVDFFDQITETVVSPDPGQILFMVISPAIDAYGLICGIGVDPS